MDLTNVGIIKRLCRELEIRPSKKLGQNFLISKKVLEKIVEAGELKLDDQVLEIGPGLGVLTQELVQRAGQVIAVERDRQLAEKLKTENLKLKTDNLEIVNDDILKFPISNFQFLINGYKVISNLPYQITSPVLWKFLQEEKNKSELMVLMVQQEVGERMAARPGQMSLLSVFCQFYADVEIVMQVPRNNFWPEPEVDSVVVKLVSKCQSVKVSDEKEFFRMVKMGFSAKRKMLKNNLAAGLQIDQDQVLKILKKTGINEKVRAQELSVEQWIKIYKSLEE